MSAPLDLVMVKGAYDRAGGPETLLRIIADHLDRERVRPLLALLARPGAELPPILAGVAADLPTERLAWHGLGSSLRSAREIAGLLRDRPGAVLHTNDMRADLIGFLITRFVRVPWIAHVHGWLRHTHAGRHKVYEDIDRWLIRSADLVLVGSKAMAEEARLAGAGRIEIVSNGVAAAETGAHHAAAAAIRTELVASGVVAPEGVLIGMLGRLHPGKGQSLMIEALAQLRRQGRPIGALIVGEGPAEAEYRALAAERGVAEAVRFAGLVDETRPFLRAMDIVCVPSLKDSLPLTALEAMSVARPVVASRAGDLPLAIEDGRNGLLVEIGSAEGLAAALDRLIADPALRQRIGEAGRASLIARYTPQAMLRQLEGYCLQLAAEHARHG